MDISRLSPRQREILRAVVRDYVLTAEPVGSRTLSRKYDLGLSAATIRNELSDLEEEGLLRQPHTSAGRVPSDSGYRVFVDSLMERATLPVDKQALIESLDTQCQDLEELLHQTARLTAVLSGCTAVVRPPRQRGSRIRTVSVVPIGEAEVLLVLVTTAGAVSHSVVNLRSAASPEEVALLSNFLNAQLRDRPLDALTYRTMREVTAQMERYQAHLEDLLGRLLTQTETFSRVIVSNTAVLAQQPEFSESAKVSPILAFLEREAEMAELMDHMVEAEPVNVQIRIGHESAVPDLAECSVVTATYSVDGAAAGEIAVLGPTRLDYSAAVAAVEAMADRLTRLLGGRGLT
ncbi:MAG: heat-inducible transcription repressor HrcA [Candidatus Sericytochromatia bacterium]|nr:heat-inducible transcription repressor HrcA [Candidatus Tanganyikabacteria bacterium]